MNTCAVDYESYYDSELSLKEMSTWSYVYHPKFNAYLVAIHTKEWKWVGHPSKFDWNRINGWRWLHHNANFDGLVTKRLQRDGVIPAHIKPAEIFDTADMAAYLKCMRALDKAALYLLDRKVSKGMRNKMKGKTYEDAVALGWEPALLAYGGNDAELCYELWDKYHDQWPLDEQELSRLTRESGWRGMHLNVDLVEQSYQKLGNQVLDAERVIPWSDTDKPLNPPTTLNNTLT